MEESSARDRYAELHKERPFHSGDFTHWSSERTSATPYHFNDGVEIFVADSDLNPDDDFLKPTPMFGDSVAE